MTTAVTMLQTRRGEDGSLWTVAGSPYAASDAFAAMLISSNLATGALPKSRSLVPLWGQTDTTGAVTSVVDGAGNTFPFTRVAQSIGYELEQPAKISQPVTAFGKLATRFGTGMWATLTGAPALTQGYTGWNGSGAKSGITSRTGQPDMLKVVPAANTTEQIELQTFSTNMLTKSLGGVIGLWMYMEAQPGYQVGGTPGGNLTISMSTNGSTYSNGVIVAFNTNQIREGWNFLQFRMRNPLAYQTGTGVAEDNPFGLIAQCSGTGVDGNIVASDIAKLKIYWDNMLGCTMYFDSMWTAFASQAQVVLGNDQGANLEEIAVPIFQQYGWVGYTAFPFRVYSSGSKIIPDLNTPGSSANAQLARMAALGWDVINHTANHLSNGTLTTEGEIDYELTTGKTWQLANDFVRGVEFYASPNSSSSRLSEAVIKLLGYKLQRHARKWNTSITPFGIDNPHHVGGIGLGSNASANVSVTTAGVYSSLTGNQKYSQIKRVIDVAEAYGDTIFPFWHGITTTGDNGLGEDLTGDNLLLTASAFRLSMAYIRERELATGVKVCRGVSGFYYGE